MAAETADKYVSQLQGFLAAADNLPLPLDAEVEKAVDYAESLIDELTAPVRVAVAGGRQTGKSTLVNLLAGVDIVPSGPDAHLLPPVILRYSKTERTLAGWWDRAEKVFDGLDVTSALAESPDVVSFEIDCDALTDLWLIDVSGVDHRSRGKEARFALSRLADVLLWCSNVTTSDFQVEQKNWQLLPPHLRKHSLLILSHPDQADASQSETVQAMVSGQSQTMFRQVVSVVISQAWQALIDEDGHTEQQWEESGAPELVTALMAAVEAYQTDRLQRVRRAMQRYVVPVMSQIGQAVPSEVAAPSAPAPQDSAPLAEAPKNGSVTSHDPMADLLGRWQGQIRSLKAKVASDEVGESSAVVEEAHQLVNTFLEELVNSSAMSESTDWLIPEFEKADDLLVLLQFEDAELVVVDAMRVLWQLSDCLSWAGQRSANYGEVA